MVNLGPPCLACDHGRKFDRLDGFGEMSLKSGFKCPDPILDTSIRGQRNGRNPSSFVGRQGAYPFDKREPIFIRHPDIADQNVELAGDQAFEGFVCRAALFRLGTAKLQHFLDKYSGLWLIIDHKHAQPG